MKIKYPLLIDGGLSNVLENQGHNLNDKLWSAKLLDSNPEALIAAHTAYIVAGANCITTSSYQACIPGFIEAGFNKIEAKKLLFRSVQLAEIAIENAGVTGVIIAASIGPYGAYLADGSEYRGDYDISDEALHSFHKSKISLLNRSKADVLACETIPSFREAQVLSELIRDAKKPAWVSFSCKDDNHISDGTKIEECAEMLANNPNVFSIGVNCTHPKYISGLIKSLAASSDKKIIVYPNSGEVYNAESKTWLGTSDPELFNKMVGEWIELGAEIIGGCCRVGPDHIRKISQRLI